MSTSLSKDAVRKKNAIKRATLTSIEKGDAIEGAVLRAPHESCCLLGAGWRLTCAPRRLRLLLVIRQQQVELDVVAHPAAIVVANFLITQHKVTVKSLA